MQNCPYRKHAIRIKELQTLCTIFADKKSRNFIQIFQTAYVHVCTTALNSDITHGWMTPQQNCTKGYDARADTLPTASPNRRSCCCTVNAVAGGDTAGKTAGCYANRYVFSLVENLDYSCVSLASFLFSTTQKLDVDGKMRMSNVLAMVSYIMSQQ